MKPTGTRSNPAKFWGVAHSLAAHLMGEGSERCKDPLVWVAALKLAEDGLFAKGGPEFTADYNAAKAGLLRLNADGVSFTIEEARQAVGMPRRGPPKKRTKLVGALANPSKKAGDA